MNELKLALMNITHYKDFADYEAHENNDKEEFDEKLDNGYIQDITLGTYNGATNTTRYWALTPNNIIGAILQDIRDTDLYSFLAEVEERSDMNENDYIMSYVELYTVFTIDGHVYVNKD